jgi:hypothetical protein
MLSVLAVASSVIGSIVSNGGRWDEPGLVGSLDRKGFTPSKCVSELIANSWDAQSQLVIFKVNKKLNKRYINMIDIGKGMTLDNLDDMFAMFKSNNKLRKSMGVSGLGGKEALYMLSKKNNCEPSTVVLFTKTADGPYLKATIPWGEIISLQLYTGKIQFSSMTEEEILDFSKEREGLSFQHGTTIRWEYSEILMEALDCQFDKNKREKFIEPKERWDLIFGISNIKITLEKSDGTPVLELPKYNYFGDLEIEYYCGKNIEIIEHYVDDQNKDRFIWINENQESMEIKQTAKTVGKIPTNVIIHQSWKQMGTYEVYNGMRKNAKIFNELNPKKLESAALFFSSYDSNTFDHSAQIDKIRDYLSKVRLYRNEQCVTEFKLEGYNSATARGGGQSMLKTFHHRTEVHYSTFSTQDNKMDIAMGIQENKNQNQNEFPKAFERLVSYLKECNLKLIDKHFDDVIKNFIEQKRIATIRQPVQPVQPVQLQIEDDSDSDSDSDSYLSEATEDQNNDLLSVSSSSSDLNDEVSDNTILDDSQNINEIISDEVNTVLDIAEIVTDNINTGLIEEINIVTDSVISIPVLINKEILISFILNNFSDETDSEKINKLFDFAKTL